MPKKSMELLTETMFYVLMAFCKDAMCGIYVAEFIEKSRSFMPEYGKAYPFEDVRRYLPEHASCICAQNAVSVFAGF